jgi:hypothetical protein
MDSNFKYNHSYIYNSNKQKIEFKVNIGTTFEDNDRNIVITDRKFEPTIVGSGWTNNRKMYRYHCNKCGWNDGWIMESCLVNQKQGCSCCKGRTTVQGINDIATTHPHLIKYFVNKNEPYMHGKGNHKRTLMKCPNCGYEKEMTIKDMVAFGFSCNRCGDGVSYPNKFMFSLLSQLGVDFMCEYSPDWIKPKRYDFYIPSLNLIIEMDGGIGHGKKVYSNSKISPEECRLIDKLKDDLAFQNDIIIIRIDSCQSNKEYIKDKILNSYLNFILALNTVNWISANNMLLAVWYCWLVLLKRIILS